MKRGMEVQGVTGEIECKEIQYTHDIFIIYYIYIYYTIYILYIYLVGGLEHFYLSDIMGKLQYFTNLN